MEVYYTRSPSVALRFPRGFQEVFIMTLFSAHAVGAPAVQEGRLCWSHECFQAGPELGNGGRDIWTLYLCSAGGDATILSPLPPSCQCPL